MTTILKKTNKIVKHAENLRRLVSQRSPWRQTTHLQRPVLYQSKIQRGQEGYGRPLEGSKTEQRGKDAHSHISREVTELCRVILESRESGDDGRPAVRFGTLFERYVTISNKLVGVLLRARKQGLVHFEGEMLWQGRDDGVIITLLE
ncbi:actin-binding Rho-activating protein-like isoform X2 [Carassius carassius]|uniref:actin-binding Rho-activating protein-like isoform X2 n=1 Tax=Carassius carassius TaxID=217509 RepID=UPI0028692DF8|nr:actin-binding Rho-activating protein-like isoform X2 [Carassius carassius]